MTSKNSIVSLWFYLQIITINMSNGKRNIVIVEDDPSLRHSFVSIINQSASYAVVGEYEDLKSAIKRIHDYKELTILLDVHLRGCRTVDSINQLKRINPYHKVIMLSSDNSYPTIVDCIRNGADGYLVKEDAVLAIGSYLDLVYTKDYVLSPAASDSVCNFIQTMDFTRDYSVNTSTTDAIKELSQAQKLVYRELIKGKSYQYIGNYLGISKNTVGQHVQRIYKAFGINSRSELMAGKH